MWLCSGEAQGVGISVHAMEHEPLYDMIDMRGTILTDQYSVCVDSWWKMENVKIVLYLLLNVILVKIYMKLLWIKIGYVQIIIWVKVIKIVCAK